MTDEETKLTPTLRAHLEWAWNYAIASNWQADYTTKAIARDISGGILRGEDAEDHDLLEDFARNYAIGYEKSFVLRDDWEPELEADKAELYKLLRPIVDRLIEEGEL